jgi:hypothetical protein
MTTQPFPRPDARRPGDDPRPADARRPGDDLEDLVARALRSREPAGTAAADRVAAHLDDVVTLAPVTPLTRRGTRVAAVAVVSSALAVTGAGAAAAAAASANPYSGFAVAVEGVAQAVGLEWSAMPEGFTREQYTAFWDAGYTSEDVEALSDLWQSDATTAKARAGQLLLDGDPVPVAPGSHAESGPDDAALDAFWDAGYTFEDAQALAELWQVDTGDAKARAGQLLLSDDDVPVAPGMHERG